VTASPDTGTGDQTPLDDLLGWDEDAPDMRRRTVLEHILGVSELDAGTLSAQRIKKDVHRLRYEVAQSTRSVIVKRFDPDVGHRNFVLVTRWLPLAGLQDAGPVLLRTVAEPRGRFVWHVYEDLGEMSLDSDPAEAVHVERSVGLVAAVHMRFAGHPLLAECRLWGGDLGMAFYHANVVDAIRALEALRSVDVDLEAVHRVARDSLLESLRLMLDDEDRRRSLLAAHGGPETLLHGDLWRKNVLLVRSADGQVRPRLIDWDHVAVGQVSYDLSTLLSRFPRPERPAILARYRARVAGTGWRLPDDGILNELFDTAERSRIANRAIWPALQIRFGSHVDWALEQLIEVRRWFDRMEPVLP
jgi:hypothetical protein